MRTGAAALGAAIVLTACAGSDYRYVGGSEASDGAYFKVPKEWTTFRIDNDQAAPTDRPAPITAPSSGMWTVVFDGAPDATLDHASDPAPAHPIGVAMVIPLSGAQRDQVNLKALRSLATQDNTDPIEAVNSGSEEYEIVRYQDVSTSGGLVGERVVFNRQVEPGVWVTADHTALMDPDQGVVYRFIVKCVSTCFQDNQQQIDEVVKSWQVRT